MATRDLINDNASGPSESDSEDIDLGTRRQLHQILAEIDSENSGNIVVANPRSRHVTRRLPTITREELFTRFPSVPRVLPTSNFANVLNNSSLVRTVVPPARETRTRRPAAQRQAIRARVEERLEQLNARADARQDEENHTGRVRMADTASSRLHAHYTTERQLIVNFKQAMVQYNHENQARWRLFVDHCINAHIVAVTNVRAYDIMRWYSKVPANVTTSLNELSKYYHSEARMQNNCRDRDAMAASLWRTETDLDPEILYASARFGKSDYGFESNANRAEAIEKYTPRFHGRRQLKHLLASFEVCRVRLEQAEAGIRFPGKPWGRSLDSSVLQFLTTAVKMLGINVDQLDEAAEPEREVAKKLYDFMDAIRMCKNTVEGIQKGLKDLQRNSQAIADARQRLEEVDRQLEG